MKPSLIFFVGLVVACVALAADFISTPKYSYLFATIIVCDLIAFLCFGYLIRLEGKWTSIVLLPAMVALFSFADVVLRMFFGARVLDMFL